MAVPEGDIVHRTADRLDRALRDTEVTRAELRWPSAPDVDLRGSRTLAVLARGKHLLHRFDTGSTLHTHLRMEGQWRLEHCGPHAERVWRRRDLRAGIATADWLAAGLRLGMLDLIPTAGERELVGHLGPDLLGPDWDEDRAVDNLLAHGGLVGDALLDQRTLAGIGTFWASEVLFLERLLPWTPAHDIGPEQLRATLRRAQRLMVRSVRTGWQGSTGIDRAGEEAYVHARSGRPCRRCGDVIRVAMSGRPPRERTLFSCPTCQRGRAPTDDGRPQRPLGAGPAGRRTNAYRGSRPR
ncbi:MAG: DNA-formamidopyrimidine glycosylase family protein [Dermatophilaceae bacterium]